MKMMLVMMMMMMTTFGLTKNEHDGSDASGSDDSDSESDGSEFAGSSDSGGPAKKRKRNSKHSKKKNKHAKKKIAMKQKRTTRKNQYRAARAAASAAPAAASAAANDGYLLRRLRHRRRSPLRAVGSAARVVQAIGGTRLGSRRSANLVGHDACQQEDTRHQRLPIRD